MWNNLPAVFLVVSCTGVVAYAGSSMNALGINSGVDKNKKNPKNRLKTYWLSSITKGDESVGLRAALLNELLLAKTSNNNLQEKETNHSSEEKQHLRIDIDNHFRATKLSVFLDALGLAIICDGLFNNHALFHSSEKHESSSALELPPKKISIRHWKKLEHTCMYK